MRAAAFLLLCSTACASFACKTTRESRPAAIKLDSLDNEDQLPACDDITLGRIYWVRSLNQQMSCAEGGTWQPRELDTEGNVDTGTGPRGLP